MPRSLRDLHWRLLLRARVKFGHHRKSEEYQEELLSLERLSRRRRRLAATMRFHLNWEDPGNICSCFAHDYPECSLDWRPWIFGPPVKRQFLSAEDVNNGPSCMKLFDGWRDEDSHHLPLLDLYMNAEEAPAREEEEDEFCLSPAHCRLGRVKHGLTRLHRRCLARCEGHTSHSILQHADALQRAIDDALHAQQARATTRKEKAAGSQGGEGRRRRQPGASAKLTRKQEKAATKAASRARRGRKEDTEADGGNCRGPPGSRE